MKKNEWIDCEIHGKWKKFIYPNGCPLCIVEKMKMNEKEEDSRLKEKHEFK